MVEVNQYETMTNAVNALNRRGYTSDFNFRNGRLHVIGTDITLSPDDITIVEYHRFEGNSTTDDMAVVYAVESRSGIKGMIIDAYGTYASAQLAEFIREVKVSAD